MLICRRRGGAPLLRATLGALGEVHEVRDPRTTHERDEHREENAKLRKVVESDIVDSEHE